MSEHNGDEKKESETFNPLAGSHYDPTEDIKNAMKIDFRETLKKNRAPFIANMIIISLNRQQGDSLLLSEEEQMIKEATAAVIHDSIDTKNVLGNITRYLRSIENAQAYNCANRIKALVNKT